MRAELVDESGDLARREGEKTAQRKRQILEAASRVFRRQGLHSTGMRDIAAELGMTAGNLYYYFENRQELLAFCQQDFLSGLMRLVAQVEALGLRPDEGLFLLIAGHIQRLNEGTPGSLAHLEVEVLEPRWREVLIPERNRYESALRRQVEAGVARGVFRPVDPKLAVLAVLGAANWTVKWFRPEGTRSAREIAESFAEHLVRGLLASGAELTRPAALDELTREGEPTSAWVEEAGVGG
jgi:AcrR family transcriptional regulator